MEFLDPKFRDNKGKYVAQCTMATLVMFCVLEILDAEANSAIIAALGASSFIAFTMPHAQVSRPRFLVGGYAVCIVTGLACRWAASWAVAARIPLLQDSWIIVFAALALGLSIFIMVITNLEHPPAASLALGLVLNECSLRTVLVVAIGIVMLATVKTVIKPALINLL